MKKRNRKGAFVATSYYQFLKESKRSENKEPEDVQPEDTGDEQTDKDQEKEQPPVKSNIKEKPAAKVDYEKMKESLAEFDRILNQAL